jgi:hypothetical protein
LPRIHFCEGQPKFGGDAVFSVAVTEDSVVFPMMLEFGITRDSEEDPPEDYTGQMYYTCTELNICTGYLDNLPTIIGEAVGVEYPDYSEFSFELYRVDVKAMDPSVEVMVDDKKVKRQNYFLENVCEVDA